MGIVQNMEAQFMLLAGFIIAIGLVITTVLLNSIIFEGNMAIEGGSELSKDEITNLLQITRDEVKSAYTNSTALGVTKDNAITNFTRQLNNFSANLSGVFAIHGESVNLTWDIENWNSSIYANFTENGMPAGTADWTVIEGVRNTTIFEFSSVGIYDYFLINVTNSSARLWSMNITTSNISIFNKTGDNTIYPFNSYIDVLNSSYQFNTNTLNEVYNINFIHGNNSWGRFAIEGNNTIYYKKFIRKRDFILNATPIFSTSRLIANITIPVSVPW